MLQDALDGGLAWRIKEIDDLRKAARTAEKTRQRSFIRAGIAILYAHWEGYVKSAAENYVNYIACQSIPYRDLRPCFIALGLRAELVTMASAGRFATSTAAVEFLLRSLDKPAKLPMKGAVDMDSNLSSTVFANIAGWIGVDTSRYETKFHFVDESLVKRRNQVAHGEYLELDEPAFQNLVDETIQLIRWFKTDIENALAVDAHIAVVPLASSSAGRT